MSGVVYVSGPMTGWAKFNRPWFDKTSKSLRRDGFKVLNPHEFFGEDIIKRMSSRRLAWWAAMTRDIAILLFYWATRPYFYVFAHRRWQESRGARAEVALARWLGVTIVEDI